MNPQTQVGPRCGAEGKHGAIGVHSRHERRYRCKPCGCTFSETQGTAYYRLKKRAVFGTVITLLAYGCPVQAVMAAYGLSDKTVRDWAKRAGQHCEGVHEQTVMRRQWDLEHIQADEIQVSAQGGILWMALVMVVSTRLWLGSAVSTTRGKDLIETCVRYAARCALCRPLLLAVDGLNMYLNAAGRSRALVRCPQTLIQAMFLQGCVYNFCTPHASLALLLYLPRQRRRWVRRTLAMAAGLTDHCWSVPELLHFRLERRRS